MFCGNFFICKMKRIWFMCGNMVYVWGHSRSTEIVLASVKVPAEFGLGYMQLGSSASHIHLGNSASSTAVLVICCSAVVPARQQCQLYGAWQQCQLDSSASYMKLGSSANYMQLGSSASQTVVLVVCNSTTVPVICSSAAVPAICSSATMPAICGSAAVPGRVHLKAISDLGITFSPVRLTKVSTEYQSITIVFL